MKSAFGVQHTVSKAIPKGFLKATKKAAAVKKPAYVPNAHYAGQAKYNAMQRAKGLR